jgi:hypothetical protein
MKEFEDIYLSWRKSQGGSRFIVGILNQNSEGRYHFKYLKGDIKMANLYGFSPYTEFPDIDKSYNGNVLDIFAQRLIKSERTDIQSFYDFWEIDPLYKDDKFYMLAHTQGLSTIDNFEFLADFKPIEGLHFLTDLANVSGREYPAGTVKVGDKLHYRLDPKNVHDPYAVNVFKDELEIGFIKRIHSRVFHKLSEGKLTLKVKALDQNGVIRRIFVKVSKQE